MEAMAAQSSLAMSSLASWSRLGGQIGRTCRRTSRVAIPSAALHSASNCKAASSPALGSSTSAFVAPFAERIPAGYGRQQRAISSRGLVRAEAPSENGDAKKYDYDLFTIGAGSGGVRAARFSAQFGAKVAVCELPFNPISSDETGGVGGTCVIRGCVPKKLLVYGSHFHSAFTDSKGFGWTIPTEPTHNFATLIAAKNKELDRLTGVYKKLLDGSNVKLIEGRGKLVDKHTVDVNGTKYTAKHILLSTGGRAFVPNIPGKEHVITSDEALELKECPKKIAIVGGGYIALEFAGIFNSLGAEVHVYVRKEKVLRGFDEEIRDFLTEQLKVQGIHFHPKTSPSAIEKGADGKLTMQTKEGHTLTDCDQIMFATGRKPNTKGLNLEAVGVELNQDGAVKVDEYSRTSVPNIWAIGDVTNRINLTPVALMEGMALARTLFNDKPTKPDHRDVASAVFTQPPIGTVGYTEEEAITKFGDVDVYTSSFRPMKNTLSGSPIKSFMKLIVDVATDKVVGVHMCGEDSAEILQGIAIAVKGGATKALFDSTVGIHPTAAEEFVTMRTPTRQHRVKAKPQEERREAAGLAAAAK